MAEQKKAGRPTSKVKAVEEKNNTETKQENITEKGLKQKIVTIPLHYNIPVKSGVQGGLVYVSRKSGAEIVWNTYGDIEYLPYEELVSMKNTCKRFFVDNWIFFEDTEDYTAEEIYKCLMVDKYYKIILEIESIDELLMLNGDKLENRIINIPNGVRDAIITRAKQLMVENNEIMDSISKREIIERVFDVELIPKDI